MKYSSEVYDFKVMTMSKEVPVGLTAAEKFFGLLIIIIGAILVYFTYTSPPASDGQVANYSFIFMIAGFALIAFGIFLLLVKSKSE
jgi:heme/copper-type cytochrome/quinol oxidase subunit 4